MPADTPNVDVVTKHIPDMMRYIPNTKKQIMEQSFGLMGSLVGGPQGAGILGGVGNIMGQYADQGAVPPFWTGGGYTEPVIPEGGVNVDWGEAGAEGALQGTADLLGFGFGKGIAKAWAPATRTAKPEAQAAKKWLEEHGGRLAAPQESTGRLMGFGQTVAETGIFGKGVMEDFAKQYQTAPIRSAIEETSKKLGQMVPVDDAGTNAVNAVLGSRKAKMRVLSKEFKAIDDAVGGEPIIDLKKSKELWEKIVKEKPAKGSKAAEQAQAFLDYYKDVDKTTYERAAIEQSDLFDIPTAVKQASTDNDSRLNTKMRNDWIRATYEALNDIEMPPVELGSNMSNQYRRLTQSKTAAEARKKLVSAYREAQAPYSKKQVKELLRTEGGVQAFNKIVNQRSPSKLVQIKKAIGNQKEWEELQSAWLADKLTPAAEGTVQADKWIDPETKLFNYTKMLNEIEKMGPSYDVFFSGSQKKAIDELIDAIRVVEKNKSSRTGAIWIQLKQAGALSALAGGVGYYSDENRGAVIGGIAGAATGALGGPYLLAKLFTNPTTTSYLARAMKADRADLMIKAIENMIRHTASKFNKLPSREEPDEMPEY
jgi:hypothetical protein